MQIYFIAISALIAAFVASFVFTPSVIRFAKSQGISDKPDGRHPKDSIKLRFGGTAIFIAFVLVIVLFAPKSPLRTALIAGGFIAAAIGALDDIKGLKPYIKLSLLTLAAIVPVYLGIRIEWITVFGKVIVFGNWSIPVTIIWILVLTNAMNLIDGLDGLASGISVISSLTLTITAFIMGQTDMAVIAVCLCGACLGFIPFNIYPAKITLGDTGALFIGYIFAVLSIDGLFKVSTAVSYLIPAVLFSLPLSDIIISALRRSRKGGKITIGDRGHLHYRLADSGLGTVKTVSLFHILTLLNSIGAILIALGLTIPGICAVMVCGIIVIFLYRYGLKHNKNKTEEGAVTSGE
ncbi:MAG: MraY family glycosyltransferase [Eubacteriales bacterium]|nr:MraY family glycosyltransferase [Eubacteriales bacterium]